MTVNTDKMAALTDEDKEKAIRLFESVSRSMTAVADVVKLLLCQKKDGLLPTEHGHSLLELKNQMMLSYLLNLVHVVYEKTSGNSIEDLPDIERLVEMRTVLERLQPVEKKLKNTFDRKIKAAVTGVVDKNDPMSFKPNPQGLLSESEDENPAESDGEETEEEEEKQNDDDVYKPSKTTATYYDESKKKKEERLAERLKKRHLRSEAVNDFISAYTEAPEEISHSHQQRMNRQMERRERERTDYEENYLTRLPPEKKSKSSKKRKASFKRKGSKRRRTH